MNKNDMICEKCLYYVLDDDGMDYVCTMYFDEDDVEKTSYSKNKTCKFFREYDEYKTVRKGAQNEKYIRDPNVNEFKELFEASGNNIVLVDIAPEMNGSEKFIKEINPICSVSIAHTDADYETTVKAIEGGVKHITHLFNAQTGFTHRKPGVVGAVFENAKKMGIQSEIICDGFHIHPAALRVAFDFLGEDNTIVISDSMRAADYKDGVYDLGGQEVFVKDGKALLKDGTIAASTSNLLKEFRNLISFGINEKQAVKSVTINPAKSIRVDDKTGSIKTGKYADLTVLDSSYNIKMVIVKGTTPALRGGVGGRGLATPSYPIEYYI